MNRLNQLFERKSKGICNIFFTAGYPNLHDTVNIALDLERQGADILEIGMPFSDPLADGETIQQASAVALKNGMSIKLLLQQVAEIRSTSEIPIVLMGYINPVLRYGLENFLNDAKKAGVDGLILPDISLEEYELNYRELFDQYEVPLTFLATPKTTEVRLKRMEKLTKTFIYFVSSASTTGKSAGYSIEQIEAFKNFRKHKLQKPVLMGFGIHDKATFQMACEHFNGAIIGSAFIRSLTERKSADFVGQLVG